MFISQGNSYKAVILNEISHLVNIFTYTLLTHNLNPSIQKQIRSPCYYIFLFNLSLFTLFIEFHLPICPYRAQGPAHGTTYDDCAAYGEEYNMSHLCDAPF